MGLGRKTLGELLENIEELLTVPAQLRQMRAEQRAQIAAIRASLPPTLATVKDAAVALRVSVPTVRRLVKNGKLRAVPVGRSLRVDLSNLPRAENDGDITRLAHDARAIRPG